MIMEDLQKNINDIFMKLHHMEMQMQRLVSDAESEKETRARINKAIAADIKRIENDIKELLYGNDRKTGIVVELDRLNQESMQRQRTKQQLFALWIAVGGLVIKEIISILMKK